MLRLNLSTQPVSPFETQPQITLHMRPLILQLYWTTYKTHVFPTASHLFSNTHTGFFFTIASVLPRKPEKALSRILESHHIMK